MSALPMPEAPQVDNAIYSDEYIEFWGARFVDGGFAYRGVTLMQFLARPRRYLTDERYAAQRPLLPRQRRVQTRLLDAELVAMHRQAPRDGELLDLAWSARR
jgi:hypothetical protein